LSICDLASPLE